MNQLKWAVAVVGTIGVAIRTGITTSTPKEIGRNARGAGILVRPTNFTEFQPGSRLVCDG